MILSDFIKFLFVGLPAFLIALPLNYFLVEFLQFQKEFSYFLVMIFQVLINFILSIKIVFLKKDGYSRHNFIVFFSIVLLIRYLDWNVYLILINSLDLYFIYVQILNVGVFAYLKFFLLKKFLRDT